MPPALLAVVVGVGVLGGHGEVVPVPRGPGPTAPAVAAASAVPAPSQPLTAAVAGGGELGPMLIPYEWRASQPPRRSDWPRAIASAYPR